MLVMAQRLVRSLAMFVLKFLLIDMIKIELNTCVKRHPDFMKRVAIG